MASRRNVALFLCADCRCEWRLWRGALVRHTRERCPRCGSIDIDLKTQEMRARAVAGNDALGEYREKVKAKGGA
jgi:hypothetical protein